MHEPQQVFLAIEATALRYGVSKRTIRRWWQAGAMPAPVRFAGRLMRWNLAELLAWEATLHDQPAATESPA
ncbi:MAG TPA: hypothetical protein VHZ24_00535 [Pirellulales bacterium]|jgi:excisionase family DNA binding protein|nr:hypothetical protein [Pirellulales bacterium]